MARFDDDVSGPAGPAGRRGRSPGAAGRPVASDVPPSDRDLAGFASTTRIEAAVGARRRERWLRQQACEDVSLLAACWSLAEAGRTVLVTTRAGTSRRGRLGWSERTSSRWRRSTAGSTCFPLAGLATLRAATAGRSKPDGPAGGPSAPAPAWRRRSPRWPVSDRSWRWRVTGRRDPVRGELLGAGADVAVVAPAGGEPTTRSAVYVRLSSVAELSLMASG